MIDCTDHHTAALHARMAEAVNRRFRVAGDGATAVPGLTLHRRTAPTEPSPCFLNPCLTLVVQGVRRTTVGGILFRQEPHHFLLTELGLPTTVQILEASTERPYLSIKQELDLDAAGALVADIDKVGVHPAMPATLAFPAIIAPVDADLADAVLRLVALSDVPRDAPILGAAIQRELLYRLLVGPAGSRLRHAVELHRGEGGVATALRWIRAHYDRPLSISALARHAGMAESTLHHRFRSLTGLAPLQYQKQLRLHEAQRLMLTERLDAGVAAHRVGYNSASQFSREYRRLFGVPPGSGTRALMAPFPPVPSPPAGSGKHPAASV